MEDVLLLTRGYNPRYCFPTLLACSPPGEDGVRTPPPPELPKGRGSAPEEPVPPTVLKQPSTTLRLDKAHAPRQ